MRLKLFHVIRIVLYTQAISLLNHWHWIAFKIGSLRKAYLLWMLVPISRLAFLPFWLSLPPSAFANPRIQLANMLSEMAASSEAAPVWGGVYVGPASDVSAYTPSAAPSRVDDQEAIESPRGSAMASRLIRTLSGSKETRNSMRGGSA